MHNESKKLGGYVFGFIFYFLFFAIITFGIAIIFFIILIPLAFTPMAENLWCKISGVRPLRLRKERERLIPLYKEVYQGAVKADPKLSKKIRLYIKEDMGINAFAFGRKTLVLTRGSLELLNDNCLKGLIAHEFGHFSNCDTKAQLLMSFGNLPLTFIVNKLYDLKNRYDEKSKSFTMGGLKVLCDILYIPFKLVQSIGDFILRFISRRREYMADSFAIKSGFGEEIAEVLNEIYSISFSKPQSIKEQIKSTHPPITLRIQKVEVAITTY